MIDFIKLELSIDQHELIESLKDNGYEVGGKYDHNTGEVFSYPLKAWNETIEVKFKSEKYVELTGSLHKVAQKGKNHLDFTFNQIIDTITCLCITHEINPHNTFIRNIEFGINIQPPFETNAFLRQVICYGKTMFIPMKSKNNFSLGIQCELTQFRLKMYCKKSQYSLQNENMRFEIHVDKMHYLHEKEIPIRTLADLVRIDYLKMLGALLLKTFNEIVIIDKSIQITNLTAADKKIFLTWLNPKNIETLYLEDPRKSQYQRRRLRGIQKKHSTENRQELISRLIGDKIQILLHTNLETSTILSDFHTSFISKNFNDSIQVQDSIIIADLNDSIHSYTGTEYPKENVDGNDLQNPKKILHGAWLGTNGKFYIPNPDQPSRIAVYGSPESYNKRLHLPTYESRKNAEKFFLKSLAVDLSTLQIAFE